MLDSYIMIEMISEFTLAQWKIFLWSFTNISMTLIRISQVILFFWFWYDTSQFHGDILSSNYKFECLRNEGSIISSSYCCLCFFFKASQTIAFKFRIKNYWATRTRRDNFILNFFKLPKVIRCREDSTPVLKGKRWQDLKLIGLW